MIAHPRSDSHVAPVRRNVAAASKPPDDPAAAPPLRDGVAAVHDAIDFARALVSDGGRSTAGLTMLRAEVQQLAREVRAMRQEAAALRADVDALRWDGIRLAQFSRGTLVGRLAAKFGELDARLAAIAVGLERAPAGPAGPQAAGGRRPSG